MFLYGYMAVFFEGFMPDMMPLLLSCLLKRNIDAKIKYHAYRIGYGRHKKTFNRLFGTGDRSDDGFCFV